MNKYRKKPVVIEAIQLRAGEQDGDLAPYVVSGDLRYTDDDCVLIRTLEGEMTGRPGDWIIKGVNGEIYPCKPDIFAKSYDAVE